MYMKNVLSGFKIILTMLFLQGGYAFAQDDMTASEKQNEKINLLMESMKTAGRERINSIVVTPPSTEELGCLTNIRGIDISVFKVDPLDAWGLLYDQLKKQLYNQVCKGVSDWTNDVNTLVDNALQNPYIDYDITLDRTTDSAVWESIPTADVELTNDELDNVIATDILGKTNPRVVEDVVFPDLNKTVDTPVNNEPGSPDAESNEDILEQRFRLQQFFKESE